jgi:hypothetical protein
MMGDAIAAWRSALSSFRVGAWSDPVHHKVASPYRLCRIADAANGASRFLQKRH